MIAARLSRKKRHIRSTFSLRGRDTPTGGILAWIYSLLRRKVLNVIYLMVFCPLHDEAKLWLENRVGAYWPGDRTIGSESYLLPSWEIYQNMSVRKIPLYDASQVSVK